jgi:hypothetical protein
MLMLMLLPGTEEHRVYEATHPGHVGTGMGTHTGTGMGHTGTGYTDTGMGHTEMGHTGMGHTGTGTTGMGMGGTGHYEGEKKSMGEKIKEAIPGEAAGWEVQSGNSAVKFAQHGS